MKNTFICGPINGFCSIIRSDSKSRHSSSVRSPMNRRRRGGGFSNARKHQKSGSGRNTDDNRPCSFLLPPPTVTSTETASP